jgi:hypothetical protein
MNKVNLILLIIAMFTGFPAIVAVSQSVKVTTPSEAYFSQSVSSVVQSISFDSIPTNSISSNSILVSSEISSSSSQVFSSSLIQTSSSELAKSSDVKIKIIDTQAPKVIELKAISSASKILEDIKKPEIIKEIAKPVTKQEVKIESKTASITSVLSEIKPIPEPVEIKPIIVSSSSAIASSSDVIKAPKANLTYAEQITARCEILGCNSSQLIRIMKCESSGNPSVVGSGLYVGLFQFLPSTFNAYKIKAGLPKGDIYNGSDQIHVATYMFANGQASQWGCK